MASPPPGHCAPDVAAYALGALEPAEVETFHRHLQTCAVCSDELASFQQVVDGLAISAPSYDAPPAVRRRVMRVVADEPRPEPAAPRHKRRAGLTLRLTRPTLALSTGLALVVAAVLVVVLALPGGPSTRTVAAHVTGQGSASLRVSGGHAQLIVHHFPAPPQGKIYEVWLRHGSSGSTQPANALFSVRNGKVDVPGSLHGVSQVLVTPEPAGGSRHPTHAPVINATL